jgi:hypothetical protein
MLELFVAQSGDNAYPKEGHKMIHRLKRITLQIQFTDYKNGTPNTRHTLLVSLPFISNASSILRTSFCEHEGGEGVF